VCLAGGIEQFCGYLSPSWLDDPDGAAWVCPSRGARYRMWEHVCFVRVEDRYAVFKVGLMTRYTATIGLRRLNFQGDGAVDLDRARDLPEPVLMVNRPVWVGRLEEGARLSSPAARISTPSRRSTT